MLSVNRKLLVIAYIFPPLARAGVHRTIRFVRYLPQMGWDITVLTAAPSYYPSGSPIDYHLLQKIPKSIKVESTKVFQGTRHLFQLKNALRNNKKRTAQNSASSKHSAINNASNQTQPSEKKEKAKGTMQSTKDLLYDLITIPDKDVNWLPYALARAVKLHRREKLDLIYSTAPPFTGHLVAHFAKKFTGLPWVADFRDPWARAPWKAEILDQTFRGKAADRLEKKFVTDADRIILNTEWNRREFTQHYGERAARKFSVITNGFDPSDFSEINHSPKKNGKLVITHTGALYRRRNPKDFLSACENLVTNDKISPNEIEIRFVGGVAAELQDVVACNGALQRMIKFIPPVSHQEALQHQLESDVLLVLQPGTSVSVPGKIFEYIGMRKNILALTPQGATADVVRENALGIVVEPSDRAGIENALIDLVQKYRAGKLESPALNGAFKRYDGIELTKKLHHELLKCIENG